MKYKTKTMRWTDRGLDELRATSVYGSFHICENGCTDLGLYFQPEGGGGPELLGNGSEDVLKDRADMLHERDVREELDTTWLEVDCGNERLALEPAQWTDTVNILGDEVMTASGGGYMITPDPHLLAHVLLWGAV